MLQMTRTYCWSGWCAYWRYESDEDDVGEAGGYKGGRCCGGYIWSWRCWDDIGFEVGDAVEDVGDDAGGAVGGYISVGDEYGGRVGAGGLRGGYTR